MISPSKEHFEEIGKQYTLYRTKFKEFVEAILPLKDSIPSLEFGKVSDIQIEFNFLGNSYCIRHVYTITDDGMEESRLLGMSKAIDDDKYAEKTFGLLNETGWVSFPGDSPRDRLYISKDSSDRIFFKLIRGMFIHKNE